MSEGGAEFPELPLMIWLSPAFPVGAFAYSHGLEWAVESGAVKNAGDVRIWLSDLLAFGAIRSDCVLLAEAYHAARALDRERLENVNELALALSPSAERRLETATQGAAFVIAARAAWPCAALDFFAAETAYPVAVGAVAAGHGAPLQASCEAFALAFVANLVSAAVRLGPIGQTDAQKITAALLPEVSAVGRFAARATLDDLGGCAVHSDIASMRHETQYSRLFRS